MWRKLSLRLRINLLFATLLTLALGANIATLITGAGARVRSEVGASTQLSVQFVEAALSSLREAPDPRPALGSLISSLQNIRHVRIYLSEGGRTPPPSPSADNGAAQVPEWFAALTHAAHTERRIQANVGGRNYGEIVIAAYPWNEISEVWREARNLAFGGATLAALVFGLTYAVAGRALAPIRLIGDGLTQMKSGDYAVSILPGGAPELRDICAKVNGLAEALAQTTAENRMLTQKLITVQDDERKQLARELHDEMGPYLFAIRAGALSLAARMKGDSADRETFSADCATLIQQVNEVQRMNSNILRRLRPQALVDLGATEALKALAASLGGVGPALDITLSLPPEFDRVDETAALTIYRIVQEGLTNVRRHAGATRSDVAVIIEPDLGGNGKSVARVTVTDNGAGLPERPRQGLGLLGMGERVRALGGAVELRGAPGGGTTLVASLPVTMGDGETPSAG